MTTPPPILHDFPLSPEQRDAALARGRDVAVTAGAGTGKTRTLVARFLALLDDGVPLRSIVAVTFTRKAAREMRNRVRQVITETLSRPNADETAVTRWQDIYNGLDAARIGTIHNLCGEILRTHPAEAGIDPRFDVLDETQSALLLNEVIEAALAWAADRPETTPLFALLPERPLQDLIRKLLANRQDVAAFIDKTPPETILDFWRAQLAAYQAEELERLLARPEWQAATSVLRENRATNPADVMADKAAQVLNAIHWLDGETHIGKVRNLDQMSGIRIQGGIAKNWPGGAAQLEDVKDALKIIVPAWKKAGVGLMADLNAQDEALAAAMPAIYDLFTVATDIYHTRKAERNALDFDDLESGAIDLLANYPAVAAYWQEQVGALLVDEFQDTNERQRQLVRLLCPTPGRLFIVGDAKQSIYRFRGADVTVFNSEKAQIGAQDGLLVDLDISYRAHEQLLTAMNRILQPVLGEDEPGRPPWIAPFAPLRAGQDTVLQGLTAPFVSFHLSLGNKEEALPVAAAALAGELARLQRESDLEYKDFAILCRAAGGFQTYENALDAAGIPYVTVSGKGFYERPEVRDLLNALSAVADPHDDLALAGMLRSPACGLADVTLYRLVQARPQGTTLWATLLNSFVPDDPAEAVLLHDAVALIDDLNRQAGRARVADILKQFLDRTHYRAILRQAGQTRALRNVSKLLLDVHTSELVSISRFLEYAQTLRDSGSREGEARSSAGGAVQIMTIHAAKGLEFPVVVLGDAARTSNNRSRTLIDSELGIMLPQKNEEQLKATAYGMAAQRDADRSAAEDARLLYVALTRAQQLLIINGQMKLTSTGKLSSDGWLKQLASFIPLLNCDLSPYEEAGSNVHAFDLTLGDTAIRAAFYEPGYVPVAEPSADTPADPPGDLDDSLPLLASLIHTNDMPDDQDSTPSRLWQVTGGAQTTAPSWVVGQIVHEALAQWRFPAEGFDAWVMARAREYGLTRDQQLAHAAHKARGLLQDFRAQPLFREMDTADRRLHEIPYSTMVNGQPDNRFIDALYLKDGRWTVVDFKTDELHRNETLENLLAREAYEEQIRAYGRAVKDLVGTEPQLKLCFLSIRGPAGTRGLVIDLPNADAPTGAG